VLPPELFHRFANDMFWRGPYEGQRQWVPEESMAR